MDIFWLTVYVLIWPVIVAGTLFVITRAFFREWKQARAEGRGLV
ncbi:putative transporter small subunit [Paeniglutamicibacter psychrophenolicus]|nr:putative transporter small subunit [Paeniglutamicibacter psychrophenolicus]MDQ0095436.1 type IV secretory pathway VirB6-like protein [Paeniglutamicibacter psychrophenolicus]